jgi:predicted dehydrogenase
MKPENNRIQLDDKEVTRREFLSRSGKVVAGSALAGVALPHVHAAEESAIKLALIGCGGRGTGAVADAMSVTQGPLKLVAMADLVEEKLANSLGALNKKFPGQVEVTPEQCFLGFDAYKKAIDCLRPGDVAMLTTHAAFRPIHLEYAIEKGVNVFMEKSFAPDPGGTHRMLRANEAAKKKNLKIGCGLMCRHSSARKALIQKIRDGELGEIQLSRAYRLDGGGRTGPAKPGDNELIWQIRHPYSFFWVSTGRLIDYLVHQIDECCWIKDAWPVSAHGLGGRAPDSTDCAQNFDTYSIEYTFADGSKALVSQRGIPKCHTDFSTFVHGSKCGAQFSGNIHAPTVQIYKNQRMENSNIVWRADKETMTPYQAEWHALLDAIRNNKEHNETQRACYTNLACLMGRAAVHMGRIVTWDEMMASTFQFCPTLDSLTTDSPPPVKADAQGRYPVPVPGVWKEV